VRADWIIIFGCGVLTGIGVMAPHPATYHLGKIDHRTYEGWDSPGGRWWSCKWDEVNGEVVRHWGCEVDAHLKEKK
jgi:hypothetical protein